MFCIKEKCIYYQEDEFRSSYFYCVLDWTRLSRLKSQLANCIIESSIKSEESVIEDLKKYAKIIKSQQ
jgi:hypothetical protein